MLRQIFSRWNKWVTLGSVAIAIGLCVFWGAIFAILRPEPGQFVEGPSQPADLIIMEVPTATPTPILQPTNTPEPFVVLDGISVGSFVQIIGTQGAGLRLRAGAGTENDVQFIGMEAEMFEVQDGPRDEDGFTWWYLVSPYDEGRSGWAAASYLSVVSRQP